MAQKVKVTYPDCDCLEQCLFCKRKGSAEAVKHAQPISRTLGGLSAVGRKSSPERMSRLLDHMLKFPNVTHACAFVGITYMTLCRWLARSEKGQIGDGFDLAYGEEKKRFHEHYCDVRDAAIQMVEDAYVDRALKGYYEVLHDRGRIQYEYDELLLDLGLKGPAAYKRDKRGKPIPEQISHQDPEVMLAVLKAWRRDRYGAKQEIDVMHRGGVLVVGAKARDSKELEERERQMLEKPVDVEFRELPE